MTRLRTWLDSLEPGELRPSRYDAADDVEDYPKPDTLRYAAHTTPNRKAPPMKITLRRVRIIAALVVAAALFLAFLVTSSSARGADHRDYMVNGHSIVVGAGTTDCTQPTGVCPGSFVARANLRGYGVGSSCIVACDDFHQIRAWLPDYIASLGNRPDTLILMIGTNDVPQFETADIIAAMKDLRATMSARFSIRVVFGTITPVRAGSFWNIGQTGHAKATRLAVNDWLRSHPNYLGPEWARALSCGAQDLCPEFITQDDVHPNDYGAAVLASVTRSWIDADR